MNLFYFAALELGQSDAANRHTLEMCHHLAQRGHQILLFVPFKRSSPTTLHPNIQIIPVPVLYSRKMLLTTLSFYLALPWSSWRHFVHLRPEIVYTRAGFLDCIAIAPLRLFFKFTYVAELNGIRSLETEGNVMKRRLVAWLERLSIRLCDKAIGVTPELCQWAIETGRLRPEQTAAIGNGVPVKLFHPMPSAEAQHILGLDLNVRYLNFTGSLKPWHGTQTLIQALPDILIEFPTGVRLLIVGDGPEKERLMKLAQQLGVHHVIDWIGQVSIQKVPFYINASEICLALFTLERNIQTGISPIKVFEYMACGRPFITTRIGATYDDLIESCQCGILVPPNDSSALAQAVAQLLRNPEQCKRLGRQGRQIAVEWYSWAKIAERTEQFIMQPEQPPSEPKGAS